MRLAPLLALPPVALAVASAAWMISTAPGPAQIEGEAEALAVRTLTVTPEDIRPSATVWGNLRAAQTWVAVAEVQGEVIWRHDDLQAGRLIPADTQVLRVDPADYALALAQAEADLAALGAEAAQLEAEASNTTRILALERERLALSEADLTRTNTLIAQGTMPQARANEVERATLLARRTVAELENALALVPAREARIAAQRARTQAALARARRALERTTLTTPFDLRVTEVSAERFQTIAPGQVVIRGDALASVEVVAHLPIASFRRLLGSATEGLSLEDMMRDIPARLIDVTLSPLADPSQLWAARVSRIEGAVDARARSVPVVVTVEAPYAGANPPQRLPLVPNMQVNLTFAGAPIADAFALPEAALHAGMLRIVGPDNRLELRPVTPEFTQNGRVVLTQGLVAGERVVLDDIALAIPGLPLHPVEVME
ncbi:efflux RND transporter periplasmic adaptor subunit [Pararhodobacter oceanensis]|uniref:Multidrug resistance protein MdtA-like C-terminal permuted SH3 domain-containing protein n=1 Tax=Pararhodobacter oceanensis TaxID=2172121 RepID=A0A2T8HTP7_9RHOB|nr:hypothetical protein [Pararhodobacter oceanensis]PVH28817.1 hypothetical protein DDE20_11645 [Pararhodobacter oceanensis]